MEIEKDHHLFAVFDGHGGSEVAKFCEQYFVKHLLENKKYQERNYKEGLVETFFKMDELLEHDNQALLKPFMENTELSS